MKPTHSRLEVGGDSFDLQLNSHSGNENKPENSFELLPQENVSLPSTLNPYHDGRIRTAVPSKLKGKTRGNQGNFSVLQMHVQKPEMTARDLAAKRTSERTAAAAKLASTQGYRHPRRLRPQSATASPTPALSRAIPQIHSQTLPIITSGHRENSTPHVTTPLAYPDQSLKGQGEAGVGVAPNINTRQIGDTLVKLYNTCEISIESSEKLSAVEIVRGASIEQTEDAVTGQDLMQDISVEGLDETFTTTDAIPGTTTEHSSEVAEFTGEVNKEQRGETEVAIQGGNADYTARPELASRPVSPTVVKSEQARILTLFRYTQPRFIVDQLTEALVHFGTIPDLPPADGSLFTQSASRNGAGDLLISWLSEIFPAVPLESYKMKKPPTGRPRGRPKGSTASCNKQVNAEQRLSTDFASESHETHKSTSRQSISTANGPDESQLAVGDTQNSDVLIPSIPTARDSTAAVASILLRHKDAPPQPTADFSNRTVTIPRIRPILSSTALTVQGSPLKPTPVRPKKPTGRPRGRPPGSKNKSKLLVNTQDNKVSQQKSRSDEPNRLVSQPDTRDKHINHAPFVDMALSQNSAGPGGDPRLPQQPNSDSPDTAESTRLRPTATSIVQAGAIYPFDSIEARRAELNAETANISQVPLLNATSDRNNAQSVILKRRRTSQQLDQREDLAAAFLVSDPVVPQASSSVQAQQAKRRRLSQGMRHKEPADHNSSPKLINMKHVISSECATSKGLPSASNNPESQAQSSAFESNSSIELQSAPFRSSQQTLQHQNHSCNIQLINQGRAPQLSIDQESQTRNPSSQVSSPTTKRPCGRPTGAPDRNYPDMSVVALYQRQQQQRQQQIQRHMANQVGQSTEQAFARTMASSSPTPYRESNDRLSFWQQEQHLQPQSTTSAPIANMGSSAPISRMNTDNHFDNQSYTA